MSRVSRSKDRDLWSVISSCVAAPGRPSLAPRPPGPGGPVLGAGGQGGAGLALWMTARPVSSSRASSTTARAPTPGTFPPGRSAGLPTTAGCDASTTSTTWARWVGPGHGGKGRTELQLILDGSPEGWEEWGAQGAGAVGGSAVWEACGVLQGRRQGGNYPCCGPAGADVPVRAVFQGWLGEHHV